MHKLYINQVFLVGTEYGPYITVTFSEFSTECSYDILTIYDGTSFYSPELATLSGETIPSVPILAKSAFMLLHFWSDRNYSLDGFKAVYIISKCPYNCYYPDWGVCDENGICRCKKCRKGKACEKNSCSCSDKGTWNSVKEICTCEAGYQGETCSLPPIPLSEQFGKAFRITTQFSSLPPLSGSAGGFIESTNSFIIFGGRSLNGVSDTVYTYSQQNDQSYGWLDEKIIGYQPEGRYQAAYTVSNNGLYIHGGILESGRFSNELWYYNSISKLWTHLANSTFRLTMHSLTLVKINSTEYLYVVGGLNENDQISESIYRINLISNVWSRVPSYGKYWLGRLQGHTAVFDEKLNSILVYGGFQVNSNQGLNRTSQISVFDINMMAWFALSSDLAKNVPTGRVYHNMHLINDYLLIFGGNVHLHNYLEKCYSSEMLIFDLKIKKWLDITKLMPEGQNIRSIPPRQFAVSGITKEGILYVANGFNGIALSDFWAFVLPQSILGNQNCTTPAFNISPSTLLESCSILTNCISCLAHSSFQCVWCEKTAKCIPDKLECPKAAITSWWTKDKKIKQIANCLVSKRSGVICLSSYTPTADRVWPDEGYYSSSLKISHLNYSEFCRGYIHSPHQFTDVEVSKNAYDHVLLQISTNSSEQHLRNISNVNKGTTTAKDGSVIFKSKNRYYFELTVEPRKNNAINMAILWNVTGGIKRVVINNSYLEPYGNSLTCSNGMNCLTCLSNSECLWCSNSKRCLDRNSGKCENESTISELSWCPSCRKSVQCSSCTQIDHCVWNIAKSECFTYKAGMEGANWVRNFSNCVDCHNKTDCSSCILQDSCAWCEITESCFFFPLYLSKYNQGGCESWLSKEEEGLKCQSCSSKKKCKSCLKDFGCGWCYDVENPSIGVCAKGDFKQSSKATCTQFLNSTHSTIFSQTSEWAYDECPEMDECSLSLHDCQENATCFNTLGSYECKCNRGFIGDGRVCKRTCYEDCKQGYCSGPPDYECICSLGWNGTDCSMDCGCNNHSTCVNGIGQCDKCYNLTVGLHCEHCAKGAYGSAIDQSGCKECQCNGHGSIHKGLCNNKNGSCFCGDNTMGDHCEFCKSGYYGDPRNGEQCYMSCSRDTKLIERKGYFGSKMGPAVSLTSKTCQWTIPATINEKVFLSIESGSTVNCQEEFVFVYENTSPNDEKLLLTFCGKNPAKIISEKNGMVVKFITQRVESYFNASYEILACPNNCGQNRNCENNQCVCKEGYLEPYCDQLVCPSNCSLHGICNKISRLCDCEEGFYGPMCENTKPNSFSDRIFVKLVDNNLNWNRYGLASGVCDSNVTISFGGYNANDGAKDDLTIYYPKNNSKLEIARNESKYWPEARYMHAADCLLGKLYIYGGFNSKKIKTFDDFWRFSLATGWEKLKSPHLPVVGHTLTKINDTHLLILGGFTLTSSFNGEALLYNVPKGTWTKVPVTGVELPVSIGHSSILHKKTIYTFGGLQLNLGKFTSSNNLYALDTTYFHRILIPSKNGPAATFLHASMILRDFMLVGGGYTKEEKEYLELWAYQFDCGTWLQINNFNWRPSNLVSMNFIEKGSNSFVILGGLRSYGKIEENTYEVHISDICNQLSEKECTKTDGCGFCNGTCMEYDKSVAISNCSAEFIGNKCTNKIPDGNCELFKSCLSCLSSSTEKSNNKACSWCTKCQKCVKDIWRCDQGHECNIQESPLMHPNSCPKTCLASGCKTCGNDCEYTNSRQRVSDTQVIKVRDGRIQWDCTPTERQKTSIGLSCPTPCSELRSCQTCMNSTGEQPGATKCFWSASTNSCVPKSVIMLTCSAGQCSPFFTHSGLTQGKACNTPKCDNEIGSLQSLHCPESCANFDRCSTCLTSPLCNWCSEQGGNGKGSCISGKSCLHLGFIKTYTWNYGKCPEENECINGHHDCTEYETCKDLPIGYSCECSEGYERKSSGVCEPVCPGCLHGSCTAPNKCSCNFGYVGTNCTIECQCNGHSDCESAKNPHICLKCEHGTTGKNCEKCAPLHVGNAINKGERCLSCSDYCFKHTNFCLSKEDADTFYNQSKSTKVSIEDWVANITSGPEKDAVCMFCGDNTKGMRCESCQSNFFRISDSLETEACQPCQCRGHAKYCDQKSGLHCNCHNKTKSACSSSNPEEKCWMKQCSECLEDFYGDPSLEGAQCYRHIKTDQSYCLDPTLPVNCPNPPEPLAPLQFAYFGVTPQYVNVDIRIFLDIYIGKVNMFIAHDSKVLLIKWDGSYHRIILNDEYLMDDSSQNSAREVLSISNSKGRRKRSLDNSTKIKFHNYACRSPWCHVEFKTNTLLLVSNISHKAIVRIPFEPFNLKHAKFYVLIYATADSAKGVLGHISSRQDHPHIDLFVFFSVFFSCFFLLLANCIIVWKMKSIYVARRQRQRRHMEMEQMRSRPFALITIDINESEETDKRYFLPTPISLEQTDDGVADVATFFVFLPDNRVCLASALVQRRHAFRARRPSSSHA
ncbi:DgyrCDS247 [Dimorphilus gyrociliatus]|uniref:DgyrCDS247 n=1 Tax=Dimorphilus gyrociliatus TaxID=2664684 RepID=A0A7I8V459_9ANNE|nr:DgyrCDS247 [Dimorphilus gyrociliatus]